MAVSVLSSALKAGDTVISQRTSWRVYSLSENFNTCKSYPMRGKAIVLKEATKVRLKVKRSRWNYETKTNTEYDSHITRYMVLLSHYKHGIVMYLYTRNDDAKWRLVKDKKTEEVKNVEVSPGSPG